ncbi:unnamed protein product [Gadus morhua 'NCC']
MNHLSLSNLTVDSSLTQGGGTGVMAVVWVKDTLSTNPTVPTALCEVSLITMAPFDPDYFPLPALEQQDANATLFHPHQHHHHHYLTAPKIALVSL